MTYMMILGGSNFCVNTRACIEVDVSGSVGGVKDFMVVVLDMDMDVANASIVRVPALAPIRVRAVRRALKIRLCV